MALLSYLTGNITWAASFKYRDYRLLWVATVFQSVGMGMEHVALGWLVLELTDSPFMVGVASAARMAPFFFLGIVSGAVADRVERRMFLRLLALAGVIISGLTAVVLFRDTEQVWPIILLAMGMGCVWAFTMTMRQAYTFDIVGPQAALNGLALTSLSQRVGGVMGALMAGLIPALRASRTSVAESLKEGAGHAGQSRQGTRLRQGLVVAPPALSLVLLVGAGLTVRGLERQIAVDPGFEASNLLSFTVRLPGATYSEEALVEAYYAEAITRLERHPGILAATSTSRLPLGAGGFGLFRSFIFDGAPPPPEGVEYPAAWVEIDQRYLETIGVGPTEGRGFTAADDGDAPLVAIVNERLARQMSPDESIIGKQIRSLYDENLPRTVVGVVPDLQFNGISRERRTPLVLVPRSQGVRASMAFLVRTAGDPNEMIPVVRQAMSELDSNIALDALQSLRDAHQADLAGFRFLTTLFATFGALAL
ncbi:MAG: MFS transporter, partial [Chloroflexi bacterium]|nr:MFS transporter [Chloroflexota bacterium]